MKNLRINISCLVYIFKMIPYLELMDQSDDLGRKLEIFDIFLSVGDDLAIFSRVQKCDCDGVIISDIERRIIGKGGF